MIIAGTSLTHSAALARLDSWLSDAESDRLAAARTAPRAPRGPGARRVRLALPIHRSAVEPCGC